MIPSHVSLGKIPLHKAADLLAPAFWSANSRTIDRLVSEGHATKTVDEDTGIDVVYRGLEVGEDPDLPDDRLDLHLMFLPDMKKA